MRPLLALAVAALAGCAPPPAEAGDHQRAVDEREALIEAMERHPALQPGNNGAASGKPINVPTTAPQRPAQAAEAEKHHHG